MTYTADLHIHSSYAYATSRELNFENLAYWAKLKGIDLLASADFTQPEWFAESRAKLTDIGDGLYEHGGVKFILGTEVSCVARVGGRGRRVHVLAFAPSLDTVARINAALTKTGAKLDGDGRPTLKMSPRDLLEMLLSIDPRCFVIPAHVWTPWFGLFGSKSGFDSLEECFGDLSGHVIAVETGLSADPAMCWRVPDLDDLSIVSFSDAHSLPKLARELTVFNGDRGELSYDGLVESLRSQDIAYTVEFFPEEGKYHLSGHRKCGVRYEPHEIAAIGSVCPVCGRTMTLGVMQRVEELSRRDPHDPDLRSLEGAGPRPAFRSLVSLQQVLSETLGVGVNTKRVRTAYMTLVETFGNEMSVLMDVPTSDLADALPTRSSLKNVTPYPDTGLDTKRLAEGIEMVRAGNIHIEPGFDGQYGVVKVWPDRSESDAPLQPLLI